MADVNFLDELRDARTRLLYLREQARVRIVTVSGTSPAPADAEVEQQVKNLQNAIECVDLAIQLEEKAGGTAGPL